ncbi:MAG TPA: carboxypeptidase regulatory-like domain-containing protein, partial [Paracoccus sp.]|nr:carboxypeptidase regulatory-like domain-containing protein [Paracoccus sp. (in: a-proteobacteria)]
MPLNLTGTAADGTEISIPVITDSSGYYVIPRLPLGTYTITRGAPPNSGNYLEDGAATAGSHFPGASGASDGLSVSNIVLTATAPAPGAAIDGEINFGLVPRPTLGLAKQVSSAPALNVDGSFDVSFAVLAQNLGFEP